MRRPAAGVALDTLLVSSGRFGQYIITLVTIPLLARKLGVHELGVLALGTSAYFYGSTFGDLGLTQALASASAGRRSVISRGYFLSLRLVLFGLSLAALAVTVGLGSRSAGVIALGFAVGACTSLSEDWLLIAGGRFGRLAGAQFAGRITYLCLLVLLLAWRPRAECALISLGIGGLVTVALSHVLVSRSDRGVAEAQPGDRPDADIGWRKDTSVVRRLIVDITGQRVMNLTYSSGIALFLGPLVPAATLGLYSASDRCVRACQAVLDSFGVALIGRLAKHRSDDVRFTSMATVALRAAFALGATAAAVLFLSSHLVVAILFGPGFEKSAEVLMFQSVLLVPVAVTTVATEAILYVAGDTRGPFWATTLGIAAAASCIPVVLATRSPFALALSAVVSEVAVAAFLVIRHRRSRARRRAGRPAPTG